MIKIYNTETQCGHEYLYVVEINGKEITKFLHYRPDGLGVCLIKAGVWYLIHENNQRLMRSLRIESTAVIHTKLKRFITSIKKAILEG